LGFATACQWNIKIRFLNSILPIIGIVLTVLVSKVLETIQKGTFRFYMPSQAIIPNVCPIVTSSLTVGLGGSAGLESPIVITGAAFG
jgi:CIC family chloride channel protein